MHGYKKLAIIFCAPMLILSVAIPVLAEPSTGESSQQSEAAKQETESKREAAKQAAETKREAAKNELGHRKEKLKDDKLKICQKREDRINGSMTNAASRGQAKLDLFSTIAARTEAFYVSKGKVLANYDDLVATVNAEKTAAQSAVDNVKASSDDFKCDGDSPKGVASLFKTDLKSTNDALKNYRTAVKNLIVGVKSVQSTTEPEGSR